MNKLFNIILGILVGVVVYFYSYDVQALAIDWFPYSWFVSGFTGWVVVAVIFTGLFTGGRIFKGKIVGNMFSILAYAILSFLLFSLFFPGYIFY